MKKTSALIFPAALSVALFTACCTQDEPLTAITMIGATERGVQDTLFVQDAILAGLKEIELSHTGARRAQNLDLRLLALRIFDDHSRANEQLLVIARENQIVVPREPREHRDIKHLQSLTGLEFDRMLIRQLLKDHRDDIKKYETMARNARRPEIREFAAHTLPILQEHLRITENIGRFAGMGTEIREAAGAERPDIRVEPFYSDGRQFIMPGPAPIPAPGRSY